MVPTFSFKLDIKSLEASIKKAIATLPKETRNRLRTSALAVLVPAVKEKVRKNWSIYLGSLEQKMTATAVKDEVAVDISSFGAKYGLNVELGAPPHTADLEKLIDYVRKKHGVAGPEGVAWANAIFRKLQDKGSEPHPYLIPTWDATKDAFFMDFVARMRAFISK